MKGGLEHKALVVSVADCWTSLNAIILLRLIVRFAVCSIVCLSHTLCIARLATNCVIVFPLRLNYPAIVSTGEVDELPVLGPLHGTLYEPVPYSRLDSKTCFLL
jgi:hypothetical protein